MDFRGLSRALRKFDYKGWNEGCKARGWEIETGYHDLWFRIYHDSLPVADCVDGKLKLSEEAELIPEEQEMMKSIVTKRWGHIQAA